MEGYVFLRPGSGTPGTTRRAYAVLLGYTIWEYNIAEDAAALTNVRREHDIIGFSPSDRPPAPYGFIFVTRFGATWHATPPDEEQRQRWLAALKVAIQLVYPSTEPAICGPDEIAKRPMEAHPLPPKKPSDKCFKSKQAFGITQTPYFCSSCGNAFYMEFCNNFTPLVQYGVTSAVRVCDACYESQMLLHHLKRMDGYFLLLREEELQQEQNRCAKFCTWWKRRRSESRGVSNAVDLFEEDQIDDHDFDGVVRADTLYHQDAALKEMVTLFQYSSVQTSKVDGALRAAELHGEAKEEPNGELGELLRVEDLDKYPLPGVEDVLVYMRMHRHGRGEVGQASLTSVNVFRHLCNTLMRISKVDIETVDFFLPQIAHLYYLMIPGTNLDEYSKITALEECLLSLSALSPQLALRFFWMLSGYIDDVHQLPELKGKLYWMLTVLLRIPAAVGKRPWALSDVAKATVLNYIQTPLALRPTRSQKERLSLYVAAFPLHRQLSGTKECLTATICEFWDISAPSSPKHAANGAAATDSENVAQQDSKESQVFDQEYEEENEHPMVYMSHQSVFFMDQLKWIKSLTSLVDELRSIPVPERKVYAAENLESMMRHHRGYHPLSPASEEICPITKVLTRDMHVFKTKARVPTLLIYEIIRPAPPTPTDESPLLSGSVPSSPSSPSGRKGPAMPRPLSPDSRSASLSWPRLEDAGEDQRPDSGSFTLRQSLFHAVRRLGPRRTFQRETGLELIRKSANASFLLSCEEDEGADPQVDANEVQQERLSEMESQLGLSLDAVPAQHANGREKVTLSESKIRESSSQTDLTSSSREEETQAASIARELLESGTISEEEFDKLVEQHKLWVQEQEANAYLDVNFFVLQTFGESWVARRKRLQQESRDGQLPGWDLGSIIVKSNDDLRQEVFAMQLIAFVGQILKEAGVDGYVRSYRIVSTSSTSGLVETITDAMSLDALKKKNEGMSLSDYFVKTYGAGEAELVKARYKFASSLAAYSLACYLFQIKDRHNGNIMLDTAGHLIHIDFGFLFGIAPGGSFSIETAPFKLTAEFVDVLGGLRSTGFEDFVVLFVNGFLSLQAQVDAIAVMVETAAEGSTFPCFRGVDVEDCVRRLRQRLDPFDTKMSPAEREAKSVDFALGLIRRSLNSGLTRQYDNFQWLTNGIAV
mmetsp:Transcript_7120/g.27276  ORF Transcript_7120/g.27276 Transcript_7120/m.27276 type:complete len:1168 (-) Transcript_7120:205-3708(-)|eukprot:scaffold7881_cov258-Pinguiococcus_pyrenoidosus.AAC.2